eukprot:gene6651-9132_t
MSSFKALSLYRNILREHRKLPIAMRKLGDDYLRNEFRLHKSANSKHLQNFFNEWENYLSLLRSQHSGRKYGKDLDGKEVSILNEDQQEKLGELLIETVAYAGKDNTIKSNGDKTI